MPLFSVRADLLPMKAHFFLFNAGTAPIVPFMPTYAKQLGLSSVLVGTIYTILPMMGLLAKPLMGAVADRFHCHKTLLIGSIFVTIISFFSMMYIPPENVKMDMSVHCDAATFVKVCAAKSKHDDCMVSKITNEHLDNSSIYCKMDCSGETDFLKAVCSNWGIPHYCSIVRGSLNYGLEATKIHALTQSAGKSAHVKSSTDKPEYSTLSPQEMKFYGELKSEHAQQVKNCLFIELGRVKDLMSNDQSWHVPYCDKKVSAECVVNCNSPALAEIAEEEDTSVPSVHYQFWLFVLLMITSWVGMAVTVCISDTICFGLLGDYPSEYGYQRLWGSIGWGLFSILAGLLVDKFSGGLVKKDYTAAFYMMAVLLLLDIFISSRIKDTDRGQSHNILRDVGRLLMNARIVVFMLWCMVVGICTALVWNFLFWYLEDLAKCSGQEWIKTLEGLIMCIQCFGGELPFFFISSWLLKKIGHVNAMSLVLFAFGVRFLLYSILVDPWWCLPIELLNGLTFGMFYATMASYASIVAPPGTEATVQGLVGAVFEGFGVSLGSFVAGILFYYMEGATVFRSLGLIVLVLCALHICVQFYLARSADVDVSTSNKGFNHVARYASPNDAISMLGDNCELTNS